MKILIVDDDPGTLNALRVGLISYKFDVAAVRAGVQALELIKQSIARDDPFCLLVTDFRMPQMDGLELIHSARGLLPDLPALLITGYGSEELRLRSDRIEIIEYIEKPFTPDILAQKISEVLKQNAHDLIGI